MEDKMNMKKINVLIVGLAVMFFTLCGIVIEQTTSAQTQPLKCSMLSQCSSEASCGVPGTANGCSVTCQDGATMTCPTKPKNGDSEFDIEGGAN
jgi:hypothetical protein